MFLFARNRFNLHFQASRFSTVDLQSIKCMDQPFKLASSTKLVLIHTKPTRIFLFSLKCNQATTATNTSRWTKNIDQALNINLQQFQTRTSSILFQTQTSYQVTLFQFSTARTCHTKVTMTGKFFLFFKLHNAPAIYQQSNFLPQRFKSRAPSAHNWKDEAFRWRWVPSNDSRAQDQKDQTLRWRRIPSHEPSTLLQFPVQFKLSVSLISSLTLISLNLVNKQNHFLPATTQKSFPNPTNL